MQRPRLFLLTTVILLLLALTACGGLVPAETAVTPPDQNPVSQSETVGEATISQPPPPAPADAAGAAESAVAALEGTLSQVYETVNPSVVHIQVVSQRSGAGATVPSIPGFPHPELPPQPFGRSEGSGFVWDDAGHIVTNDHVVANADRISVIFSDGTILPATTVGNDPDSDLAVLKVDDAPAGLLRPVQMADSNGLKVGQLVIAIGNPFGQEGTMTVGFISALGRLLPVDNGNPLAPRFNISDVIQTDAAINPGNSGGVLTNARGEVIGVTSAIISATRSSSGIGFAIPSAIVQKVVPALISDGRYEHPFLGISGTSLTPDLAAAMDLPAGQRGALVIEVVADTPAAAAGLQGSRRTATVDGLEARVGGDVIIAADGRPIQSMDDLITDLARYGAVGQTIELTILRDGAEQTVAVTLAARPARSVQPPAGEAEAPRPGGFLGILGQTLTPALAEAMGLDPAQNGVLLVQVMPGGPAGQAGLQGSDEAITIDGQEVVIGGDVMTAVDGRPIDSIEALQSLLAEREPGDEVTVTLLRDGRELSLVVTLGERP